LRRHRDDGDTSERIKSSAQLRLRNEVMTVPITPRRGGEVNLSEPTDVSPAGRITPDQSGPGALDTPDTECAETHATISSDTTGGSEAVSSNSGHTAPSKDEEGVAKSGTVTVGASASPSKSKKKNRKMKNLVKPAQSPEQGGEPANDRADEAGSPSEPPHVVSETE